MKFLLNWNKIKANILPQNIIVTQTCDLINGFDHFILLITQLGHINNQIVLE